jgi:hypothetical protein
VVSISHILFADDTLFYCGASPDHLHYLCVLIVCFAVVYGLKVNLAKLVLVPAVNVENMDGLAGILGCGTSFFPLSILVFRWGLVTKLSLFGLASWKKFECQLACWKMIYLSKGGSVTHIKSILSNLHTSCLFSPFMLE